MRPSSFATAAPLLLNAPPSKPRCANRRLIGSWHVLLVLNLAAVAALSQPQKRDWAVARQGVGSVLLALAGWQLGSVSAKRVERAVRYGLVVTLDRALRGAADYEVTGGSCEE